MQGTGQGEAAKVNMALISAIVAVATIGGLLFGYDSGAVNGTQGGLTEKFNLSEAALGFTVGSLLIGCAAGAFFAGRLADVIVHVKNGAINFSVVRAALPHLRAMSNTLLKQQSQISK